MEVPVGFLAKLWSFVSFLPFFFLLFILGSVKGIIIGPIVVLIILIGNTSVVIGLWPAHFVWTYYCVGKSKRLGWVLKIVALMTLPVPLILWPIVAIIGSLLGGIGYGFFTPLIATFEAVGKNVTEKFYHCFADGCISTLKGSCTVVRDFTDFCFHSYFSYMDELSEEVPEDETPVDLKLSKLPSSVLVSLVAILVDVPVITVVAIWKSPYMLFKGWKRLLEDLIGREGPFLETVCVPFAALAILLWPLAVMGSVIAACLYSFFLALYSGVIVHQEDSFKMGLAYIIASISLFDEYTNDLLYLREGSCFPRYKLFSISSWAFRERNLFNCFFGCLWCYETEIINIIKLLIKLILMTARPCYRRNTRPPDPTDKGKLNHQTNEREGPCNSKLVSEGSRTLKETIQQYTPVQVWDWLFKSCEINGRMLIREGLIDVKDIGECIVKGKCKKLGIKLPAWSILDCLLASAKSNSSGLVISDEVELTVTNWPRDRVFEWFVSPLFVIKEQIKGLQLLEDEEICLKKLVMGCKNEKPEDWNDKGFPSSDSVRRAQLQAVIRRLEGIVGSLSRFPTFRRRFKNLVRILYLEAMQNGLSSDRAIGRLNSGSYTKQFRGRGRQKSDEIGQSIHDNVDNV